MRELLPCPTSAAVLMSIDNRVIATGPDKGLTLWQAQERRRQLAAATCHRRTSITDQDHHRAMSRLAEHLNRNLEAS